MRTIVNMEIPAGQSSANLTLNFPQGSRFVAVMSDSTGFGTGGTSTVYTVGSGASGCLPTSTSKADFYMYTDSTSSPSQCGSYGIKWDAGVSGVHIYGVIPGGQSFDLGAPSSGTGFDWTTNVRQGTDMFFLAVGGNNENGGSTDISTVSSGSSGCINAQAPSSTAGPASGGVSTIAQSPSGVATASGANPTESGGTTGGSASGTGAANATGTPGATATDGSGGSPTVTNSPTGTNGNGNGNGNNPGASSTRGSGGGTVTGDPHLPVATDNSLDKSHRLNLGAIIGGTLGGITLILLLLLLWLFCARRRRNNEHDDSERLISETRRTDLLADSAPILHRNSAYEHDWFRAEPFVPPMSAAEFARRTGGGGSVHEDQVDEYHDDDRGQSMSSLGHGAVTNSLVAAEMYGALARTPSYSTSGHGHRNSTQLSHSRSYSQSNHVSHSPAHSTSRHGTSSPSHGHSRSFSNPFTLSFTPTSGVSGGGRRESTLTPPTPTSVADPFAAAASRPPPSSWNNHASGSANVVPRVRQSLDSNESGAERKSGESEVEEPIPEGDIVDIPPSYASLKRVRRVMNP